MLLPVSCHPSASNARRLSQLKTNPGIPLLLAILCAACVPCRCHAQRILCRDGFGSFSSQFPTGVTVTVGASRNGASAVHACDATLHWGKDVLPVAQGVYEANIDVMGADLGLGVPVVAFQIKASEADRLTTYKVFSLAKPPHLLRIITGGDEYDAKDMDLRGRNEIWTDDARAIDGLENLPLSSWDFAPTVVLRFEDQRLIDVSSEFQPYFDHQIAQVKSQLDPAALKEFRQSDGKLKSPAAYAMADLHRVIRTKIQVIEIVWSDLESGREQQAWSELADLWPPADVDRMRAAFQAARARGILHQVDAASNPGVTLPFKRHATVFDCIKSDAYESNGCGIRD